MHLKCGIEAIERAEPNLMLKPQRETEKELENFFDSLMQRAFRGELVG